jgi:hypothetical protein
MDRAQNPDQWPEDEKRLMSSILEYLAEHPNAMDSMEGIAKFWIMRNAVRVEFNKLKQVLFRLVERGVLEQVESGSNILFRINSGSGGGTQEKSN